MNEKQISSTNPITAKYQYEINHPDDRIYQDIKGRPVGLASKINRATHSVENPIKIPLMTPEDKIYFSLWFDKCVNNSVRYFEEVLK